MCLRNLFGGNDCTWILFIIIVLLLIDEDCGDDRSGGFYAKRARPNGRALLHIYDMYMYYSFTAVASASEPGPIWQDTLSDKWST